MGGLRIEGGRRGQSIEREGIDWWSTYREGGAM